MSKDTAELQQVIDRFTDTPVIVVGDLVVDHYVWGEVNRISPEAPVVVVHQTEESKRPGGAGNVVHNLGCLGARVSVCGVIGDDDSGRELLAMLDKAGVNTEGVLIDRSRPTTEKTRVIARSQQVVRVDRETLDPISITLQEGMAAELESKIKDSRGVIISDYAKGTLCPSMFSRIEKGYENGQLGLGKIPVLIDPKAPNFPLYSRATIIKPNRGEAEQASGLKIASRADAIKVGEILLEKWNSDMVLITLGELGMVLVPREGIGEDVVEIDTVAREVYDVSGAGDTVSAVFLLALAAEATPAQAAKLANYAAGIVVSEVGTVAVTLDGLREAVS